MNSKANLALFLDWEGFCKALNEHYKAEPDIDVLFDAVAEYGTLSVARAYANWQLEAFKPQSQELKKHSVKSINVPHDNQKRSSSSVKLALDALSLALKQPQINTFLLLSGDNSLVPLAHTLKHLGRQIVLVGLEPEMDLRISQQVTNSLLLYDRDIVSITSSAVEDGFSIEESGSPLEKAFSGIENLLRQAKSKGMSLRQLEFVMQHLYDFQAQQALNMTFKDIMSEMAKTGRAKLFSKGSDVFAISPNFSEDIDTEESLEPKGDTLDEVNQSLNIPDQEGVMSEEMQIFLAIIKELEKPKKLTEILKILKRRHNLTVGKSFRDELYKVQKAGYLTLRKSRLSKDMLVSRGQKAP